MTSSRVLSVLILHPEAETRRGLTDTLRRALPGAAVHVHESTTPAQALQAASWLDPKIVLVDLSAERKLALEAVRTLRKTGRVILGLYNPMLASDRGAEIFRIGVRAGVTDFIALPASEADIAGALSAIDGASAEPRRDGRVVAFVSGAGGVGTTTLAVNSALLLAGSKAAGSVVLCDAALQFGTAAAQLGLAADRDVVDLLRDLEAASSLTPYLLHHGETGLHLLASPRDPLDADRLTPEDLSRALIALRRRFDTVVVDLPARIDLMALAALDLADRVYVVSEAVVTGVVATQRLLSLLDDLGLADRIRVVLNRQAALEGNLTEAAIGQRLGRPVDRVVPYDRSVVVAANRGTPLVLSQRRGSFSDAIGELAGDFVEASGRAAAAAIRR